MLRDFAGACRDWKRGVELGVKSAEVYLESCNQTVRLLDCWIAKLIVAKLLKIVGLLEE